MMISNAELEARIADSIANEGSVNNGPRGPLRTNHVIYPELSYAIVGAAIEVHRCVAPGELEANYERALAIELRARGIPFERQVEFESRRDGACAAPGRGSPRAALSFPPPTARMCAIRCHQRKREYFG